MTTLTKLEAEAGAAAEPPYRWGARGAALWLGLVALAWWDAFHRAYTGMDGPADARVLQFAAATATLTKLAGHVVEATAYVGWWRLRGAPLAWGRAFAWIVTYSMLDVLALWMLHAGAGPFSSPELLALLAGPAALRGRLPGISVGLWTAFGATGVLALVRVLATVDRQRRMTGRGWREPLVLTLAFWSVTRLAQWWTVDLLAGHGGVPH